jgi:TrmH family RNA methyltransferase
MRLLLPGWSKWPGTSRAGKKPGGRQARKSDSYVDLVAISVITSTQNERIKYVRSLVRRRVRQREGRFVVEGTRLIEEVVRAGIKPALLLYTQAWAATPSGQRLLPSLRPAEEGDWLVSDAVLAACADTETPQGVLAVVPFVSLSPRPGLILILDRLRDPGNLGTILRSAEAAGVGQVILAPGTVDLYNPKAVRGAMGAHFRLPVTSLNWPAITESVGGGAVWLAEAAGDVAYDAVDWTQPAALIVGGEAAGAGEKASALARGRVCIPMAGGAESLNAAMAATVILFEAARQRRSGASEEL